MIVCHVGDFMRRLAPERALVLPSGEYADFDPSLLALYEPVRRGGRRYSPELPGAPQLVATGGKRNGR